MYCDFFRLSCPPFANAPDPRFFFSTPECEEALAALRYGVTQRRGFVVVTGPPGCGKTFLGHLLARSLEPQFQGVTISHIPENGHDLIASLCRELDMSVAPSQSTGELFSELRSLLRTAYDEDRNVAAIIDGAQSLSMEVLEHVCMLGNLEVDTAKLLQIVLIGQPELTYTLRDARMEQLRQQVFCSRQIGALTRDQTHAYVRHRLRVAKADRDDIFTDQAIDLIHDRSGGIPRMINQIADNGLLAAYSVSRGRVDRQTVIDCISEMMSLQVCSEEEVAAASAVCTSGEDRENTQTKGDREHWFHLARRGQESTAEIQPARKSAVPSRICEGEFHAAADVLRRAASELSVVSFAGAGTEPAALLENAIATSISA